MKFISNFTNKSLKDNTFKNSYLRVAILFPIISLCMFSSLGNNNPRGHRRDFLKRAIEGLDQMSTDEIIFSIGLGVMVAAAYIIFLPKVFNKKRIILELNFNDELKELNVKGKKVTEDGSDLNTIKYRDLSTNNIDNFIHKGNFIPESMKNKPFHGIEIYNNSKYVGTVLENHCTWCLNEYNEIYSMLQTRKKDYAKQV